MRKLTHDEVVNRQKSRVREPRVPLVAVLNNIRSLYNVGAIFRTADGVGAEKVYLCGITGCPPNNMITKTALDAEKSVPWEYREDIAPLLRELKAQGYTIVLLEQTDRSIPYQDLRPNGPVCLVLGHECDGVDDAILPLCDEAVEIDMAGLKNSLNVSVAFGVVTYRFRECYKKEA